MSPYHALALRFPSTDLEVRNAYLRLVRDHPPEREPERFRMIQQAYDTIQTEEKRLRHAVLGLAADAQVAPSLEQALLDHCAHGVEQTFPQPDTFRSALRQQLLA